MKLVISAWISTAQRDRTDSGYLSEELFTEHIRNIFVL